MNHKQRGQCPNCGYCPCCGRHNSYPVYPYPYWPYRPNWHGDYWCGLPMNSTTINGGSVSNGTTYTTYNKI